MLYWAQVMHMNREKTGELIASARKERNMTQKELAQRLHVSDRAVSKWERGAGFPDVSLLEPLANALGLRVLDLLRGERVGEVDVHVAVSEALTAFQEKQRRDRKQIFKDSLYIVLWILPLVLFCLYVFPLKSDVNQTIKAGVYQDGRLITYTDVELRGEIGQNLLNGSRYYWGRFAIDCVEWTTRENAYAGISLHGEDGLVYTMGGTPTSALYDLDTVINRDVTEFAFALQSPTHLVMGEPRAETWCILATSPEAYEAYRENKEGLVPPLKDEAPDRLPEFPSAWAKS